MVPRKDWRQRTGRRRYPGEPGWKAPREAGSGRRRSREEWAAEEIGRLRVRVRRIAGNPRADAAMRDFGRYLEARADRMERRLRAGTLRYPYWVKDRYV